MFSKNFCEHSGYVLNSQILRKKEVKTEMTHDEIAVSISKGNAINAKAVVNFRVINCVSTLIVSFNVNISQSNCKTGSAASN